MRCCVQVIGERLHCVFVDNGLLRLDEGENVMTTFNEQLKLPVTKIDATREMMDRLRDVTDPEAKRKAIGAEFIECFKRFRCGYKNYSHITTDNSASSAQCIEMPEDHALMAPD